MKPKFGDLQAKANYETIRRHNIHFNRQVKGAMRFLVYVPTLPPPHSARCEYPETVRLYSLDVLEEAVRRELQRRSA